MSNEEKAKQLFRKYREATILGSPMAQDSVAFNAAMEMAEWKDQQVKGYLDGCIKPAEKLGNSGKHLIKMFETMKTELHI